MKEEWRTIKEYPFYDVSNTGKVRSWINNKMEYGRRKEPIILKPDTTNKGYLKVNLSNKKGRKWKTIHRLVAKAFIPNPKNKPQVNHKDTNKENNYSTNLEWRTNQENRDHAVKHGVIARGEKSGVSKLTRKEVLEIRCAYRLGCFTYKDLAKAYNTAYSNICAIITRRSWNHL